MVILRLSKFRKRGPNWIKVVNPPTCSALGSRVGACGNPKVQLTSPCPSSPMQDQRFLYKRYRPRSHPYSPCPSVKRSVLAPSHPPHSQCCLPDHHETKTPQNKRNHRRVVRSTYRDVVAPRLRERCCSSYAIQTVKWLKIVAQGYDSSRGAKCLLSVGHITCNTHSGSDRKSRCYP